MEDSDGIKSVTPLFLDVPSPIRFPQGRGRSEDAYRWLSHFCTKRSGVVCTASSEDDDGDERERERMVRKGREKENVAGERYNSNAVDIPALTRPRQTPQRPQFPADLMSAMGGGGGMPNMQQMMEMMGGMGGMGGMPPGMGGMGGMPPGMAGMMPPGMAGMMPPMVPQRPKILYPYGLADGANVEKFYTFYPNYINSKKTVQEGRRIVKEAACEDPIADEMSEVCVFLKIPHALEVRCLSVGHSAIIPMNGCLRICIAAWIVCSLGKSTLGTGWCPVASVCVSSDRMVRLKTRRSSRART